MQCSDCGTVVCRICFEKHFFPHSINREDESAPIFRGSRPRCPNKKAQKVRRQRAHLPALSFIKEKILKAKFLLSPQALPPAHVEDELPTPSRALSHCRGRLIEMPYIAHAPPSHPLQQHSFYPGEDELVCHLCRLFVPRRAFVCYNCHVSHGYVSGSLGVLGVRAMNAARNANYIRCVRCTLIARQAYFEKHRNEKYK